MGEVRALDDRRVGRTVAMKTLHDQSDSAGARMRFVREARIQGQLEHPSVLPVYDFGLDPQDRPYFTMKQLRGHTLSQILASLAAGDADTIDRYSLRKLLSELRDVCLAIEFAHSRNVIHRDLKPGNIMLGDFGEVYVLDWGLAKLTTEPVEVAVADPHQPRRRGTPTPTPRRSRRPRRARRRSTSTATSRPSRARCSAPRATCRPSRSAARRSTGGPTCTRSARSCSRSSPVSRCTPATATCSSRRWTVSTAARPRVAIARSRLSSTSCASTLPVRIAPSGSRPLASSRIASIAISMAIAISSDAASSPRSTRHGVPRPPGRRSRTAMVPRGHARPRCTSSVRP